jgi:glycoside/pentoside/hexuronide:cation symporter, GPH family
VILGTVVVGKMIADVSDAHEHTTGARQEGLLFSAGMFLNKAASGLGTLASGIIIKAAHFPEGATYESVSPQAVQQLGLGAALGTLLLGACTAYFFSRFNLSRERHENIVSELLSRRAESLRSAAQQGPSA